MIPAGYMAKFVTNRSDWLGVGAVEDIYSVSGCISSCFADYYDAWKHNGFWLFDSIAIIRQVASEKAIDLKDTTFFYYELYEQQFDEDGNEEAIRITDLPFATNVSTPEKKSRRFRHCFFLRGRRTRMFAAFMQRPCRRP